MKTPIVKFDDSDLIWFDYNNMDFEAINASGISHFDICNVPTEVYDHDIVGGEKRMITDEAYRKLESLSNYMWTTFETPKGRCVSLVNRDRAIYRSKAGYVNGRPSKTEY